MNRIKSILQANLYSMFKFVVRCKNPSCTPEGRHGDAKILMVLWSTIRIIANAGAEEINTTSATLP
jgi:hypothetical protein